MCSYDVVLIAVLSYFAIYLLVLGWVGIMTDTPLVYRLPLMFDRPTIYLAAIALIFSDTLIGWLGCTGTLVAFVLLLADFTYETLRPFLTHSISVVSESREALERDLVSAMERMKLKVRGAFPCYELQDSNAKLRVKHFPKLAIADLSISPRSKATLLAEIGDVMESRIDAVEGKATVRGFVATIFAALTLFLIVFWRYLSLGSAG